LPASKSLAGKQGKQASRLAKGIKTMQVILTNGLTIVKYTGEEVVDLKIDQSVDLDIGDAVIRNAQLECEPHFEMNEINLHVTNGSWTVTMIGEIDNGEYDV
jgi:hypothetical protein